MLTEVLFSPKRCATAVRGRSLLSLLLLFFDTFARDPTPLSTEAMRGRKGSTPLTGPGLLVVSKRVRGCSKEEVRQKRTHPVLRANRSTKTGKFATGARDATHLCHITISICNHNQSRHYGKISIRCWEEHHQGITITDDDRLLLLPALPPSPLAKRSDFFGLFSTGANTAGVAERFFALLSTCLVQSCGKEDRRNPISAPRPVKPSAAHYKRCGKRRLLLRIRDSQAACWTAQFNKTK